MELYTFFLSSASYRVRIALNLKGIGYEPHFVNLLRGDQHAPEHFALNPQGLVPVLIDGERRLTQSLAICEYVDEIHPEPPLLPKGAIERARVRALAYAVACEMQPLNNPRVMNYLDATLGLGKPERKAWIQHWIKEGFTAVERILADPATGVFCHGDAPTLADICLVPQVANALRAKCDLAPFPTVHRIYEACTALPAFDAAAPHNQPDATVPSQR
jgi:maleylacetoacetate isomerase